jgi:uncharacterized ubiquitin-like protein YukD
LSDIRIDLVAPGGVVLENTVIPGDYTVRRIIHELVDELSLPYITGGIPVEYGLRWLKDNSVLLSDQTLLQAGIQDGDQIKLESSIPVATSFEESSPLMSAPADTSAQMIEIFISVLDLNTSSVESLDLDTRIDDILRRIVKTYRLPEHDDLRVPTLYFTKSKALGRILNGTETLRSAKVPTRDRLTVLRQEIAGGSHNGNTT